LNSPLILLLLLLALAIIVTAYVLRPLVRASRPAAVVAEDARPAPSPDADDPAVSTDPTVSTSVAVLRERRRELETALAHLPADAPERRQAMDELTAQAAAELAPTGAAAGASERRRPIAAALLASALIVPAFALYLLAGTPEAVLPEMRAMQPGGPTLDQMAEGLRARLVQEPDRADGWQLLGRTELARGRPDDARAAFERAAALLPTDAGIKVDLAESIAQQQGARLDGRPIELIREALAIDPRHQKGLALAGAWYVTQQDYGGAARSWQALLAELPPGSPQALQIEAFLEDVRAGRGPQFSQPGANGPPGSGPPAAAMAGVSGTVEVLPPLAAEIRPTDTLFVVARALDAQGNAAGPPVAVMTAPAAGLPLAFRLDDTMAMVPTARISATDRVVIVARISRTGGAFPQPGDLQGVTAPVGTDASNVRVLIDSVVQ
jgi:cytochrome c-type biogenesis protein CcmH